MRVTNQSAGAMDNNTIQIVDAIPANTVMCGLGGAPVTFTGGREQSYLSTPERHDDWPFAAPARRALVIQPRRWPGQRCDSAIPSHKSPSQRVHGGNSFIQISIQSEGQLITARWN